MQLQLYSNNSEVNVIGKDLTAIGDPVLGVLHLVTDVSDPAFELKSDTVPEANYCFCPELGRYYFITRTESIRNGLFRIYCHVDVLETYKNDILNQFGVVARSEKRWNLYGNDMLFKTFQDPIVVTRQFPNGFPAPHYILAVSGG